MLNLAALVVVLAALIVLCACIAVLAGAAWILVQALREFHRARAHAAQADAETVTTRAATDALHEFDNRERPKPEWIPETDDELKDAIRAQRESNGQRPMTEEEIVAARADQGLEGEPPIMPEQMYRGL